MASFNFGNDSTDLDLSVGGDQGTTPKRPAAKPAAPAPAVPQTQQPAPRPAQRPARPATTNRTANLLQGQQRPAPTAPRPAQRRQAPVQPQQPVQQPTPEYAPEPYIETQDHTFPSSQIPEPELAQQLEETLEQPQYVEPAPVYMPPAYQPPVAPQQPQSYAPPAQEATPVYAPQAPVYQQPYAPAEPVAPQPAAYASPSEQRRSRNEEPAFMARQNLRDVEDEPVRRQQPVVAEKEPEKLNPLMAFLAPFMGKGSNQNGNKADAKKKRPARGKAATKNDYAGGRQRVLIIRVVAFAIGGIVLLSGARALLFPYQGPSRAAVEQVAQEAVGYTGFPEATGQGAALAFTNLLLTFTNDVDSTRDTQLLRYTSSEVLDNINLTYNRTGLADNAVLQPQTIIQGPYIVAEKNLDKTHALITTTAQINTGQWLTMSIPMLYTASNGSVTVYGSPTFEPDVKAVKVAPEEYTPTWGDDTAVDNAFRQDLINYLTAYAADNDQSLINRYLTSDATATAKEGLGGAVKYNSLAEGPIVEIVDPKLGGDVNSRRAQFSVVWENPINHVTYSQTYRAKLKFQQQRWFIQDISNISLVTGQ